MVPGGPWPAAGFIPEELCRVLRMVKLAIWQQVQSYKQQAASGKRQASATIE